MSNRDLRDLVAERGAYLAYNTASTGTNTRLRSDIALQRAFGRSACAEQSVVQETLNACSETNVSQMRQAFNEILRQYGRAFNHNYRRGWQLLDIDLTGLPCGKKADLSHKGYFSKAGI